MRRQGNERDDALLALRYAQGAMSDEEAQHFERRLAEEPELCDALEHAVWTQEAVQSGPPLRESAAPGARRAPRIGVVRPLLAVAAAVLLLIVGRALLAPPTETPEAAPATSELPDDEDLLDLWLALAEADPEATRTEDADEGSRDLEERVEADLEELAADEDDGLPTWIWTALESS